MTQNIGEAYAFFNCSSNYEVITEELPKIRKAIGTPSDLELTLIEGPENLTTKDEGLKEIIRQAMKIPLRYVLKGLQKEVSNRNVSDELSSILNQAYESPSYSEEEEFLGEVVYKENRAYKFRD